jgi:hypothetical protein
MHYDHSGVDRPYKCWADAIQGNDTDQRGFWMQTGILKTLTCLLDIQHIPNTQHRQDSRPNTDRDSRPNTDNTCLPMQRRLWPINSTATPQQTGRRQHQRQYDSLLTPQYANTTGQRSKNSCCRGWSRSNRRISVAGSILLSVSNLFSDAEPLPVDNNMKTNVISLLLILESSCVYMHACVVIFLRNKDISPIQPCRRQVSKCSMEIFVLALISATPFYLSSIALDCHIPYRSRCRHGK